MMMRPTADVSNMGLLTELIIHGMNLFVLDRTVLKPHNNINGDKPKAKHNLTETHKNIKI